jgi:hypothetical protein
MFKNENDSKKNATFHSSGIANESRIKVSVPKSLVEFNFKAAEHQTLKSAAKENTECGMQQKKTKKTRRCHFPTVLNQHEGRDTCAAGIVRGQTLVDSFLLFACCLEPQETVIKDCIDWKSALRTSNPFNVRFRRSNGGAVELHQVTDAYRCVVRSYICLWGMQLICSCR